MHFCFKNKRALLFLLSLISFYSSLMAHSLTCPNEHIYHQLVNSSHALEPDYFPSNLVIPKVTFQSPGNIEKNYMEATAAKALEEMFADARQDNIHLVAISGYRSYSRQATLYQNAIRTYGIFQTGTAKPGYSEHQTGLAMDVNSISQSFQYTKESEWLEENAHHYGYIIRYPKDKTDITGYIYEPWHLRYVGVELATYCATNKLTLEEISSCCLSDSSSKPKKTTLSSILSKKSFTSKIKYLMDLIKKRPYLNRPAF